MPNYESPLVYTVLTAHMGAAGLRPGSIRPCRLQNSGLDKISADIGRQGAGVRKNAAIPRAIQSPIFVPGIR